MTYLCDGCDSEIPVWYGRFVFSREDAHDQPNDPIVADKTRYHLCRTCKDEIRNVIES